ncbi:helix-turn-helix domain-containing protein [Bosea sp. NBC_00550]|uniref:helix-turn-helix domain-containing protein n=1 Tax=Bosea sp. NBC_00550 TaxID=2969621 RepID=UPI0022313CFF|nr:helix-turn-helix domain-containing protein [Bosea sp. NBC_00550]UZF92075.1 helix-turn-helix domain-containing protein [Bosea sp. NBC_00550]
MAVERLLNSIKQTCGQLDCGPTKLYEKIAAGEILAIKVGGQTKIPQTEIERYIASRPLVDVQRNRGFGNLFADAAMKRAAADAPAPEPVSK